MIPVLLIMLLNGFNKQKFLKLSMLITTPTLIGLKIDKDLVMMDIIQMFFLFSLGSKKKLHIGIWKLSVELLTLIVLSQEL